MSRISQSGREAFDTEKSKKQGYKSATARFEDFLGASITSLSGDLVSPKLFEDFSIHLTSLKKSRESDENYSLGTIHQYISGVYNILKRNHPALSLWQQDLVPTGAKGETIPRWYRTVRDNASRIVCNRVIQNGEKLQNKSEPIGRNLLTEMTLALMTRNDLDGVEMATTFVWDFSSCGRYA